MKKLIINIRTSLKLISLLFIAILLFIATIFFIYKPIYSVTLNGEFLGYSKDKVELQNRINTYMNTGEGKDNIAFVKIDNLPEYKLCLLKKDSVTTDEEIYNTIKKTGTVYYKYYAVLDDGKEKVYVSKAEEAEEIIQKLKDKNSSNENKLGFLEKYSTDIVEFKSVDLAVADLYIKPVVKKAVYKSTGITTKTNFSSSAKIGIALIRPTSGKVSSRYGESSRIRSGRHTGLDLAASRGTTIVAAATGTVTFASYRGSLGNLIIVNHGNGVETYYAHCQDILVSVGTNVSQGQKIGTVGSTGNSTGPHLHFEVRVNGVTQNPQAYI